MNELYKGTFTIGSDRYGNLLYRPITDMPIKRHFYIGRYNNVGSLCRPIYRHICWYADLPAYRPIMYRQNIGRYLNRSLPSSQILIHTRKGGSSQSAWNANEGEESRQLLLIRQWDEMRVIPVAKKVTSQFRRVWGALGKSYKMRVTEGGGANPQK